jgi:hypothetical protein
VVSIVLAAEGDLAYLSATGVRILEAAGVAVRAVSRRRLNTRGRGAVMDRAMRAMTAMKTRADRMMFVIIAAVMCDSLVRVCSKDRSPAEDERGMAVSLT